MITLMKNRLSFTARGLPVGLVLFHLNISISSTFLSLNVGTVVVVTLPEVFSNEVQRDRVQSSWHSIFKSCQGVVTVGSGKLFCFGPAALNRIELRMELHTQIS